MGKVLNFNEKNIEYLNEDIESYLEEIEDLLSDELFENIREEITEKIKSINNYFFMTDLIKYIQKKDKEIIIKEDRVILEEMKLLLSEFLKLYDERLRFMAFNGQAILWRNSENPNIVALLLHKEIDSCDITMKMLQEYLLEKDGIEKIPFKYVLPSSEYGTYEDILKFSHETLCLDFNIPTDDIIKALKKNHLGRNN